MKILIVEDDYASRAVLLRHMIPYGETEVAVNGKEAVAAVAAAMESGKRFDLVTLDIMLPVMDGQAVLREIRALESAAGANSAKPARIIMTTALNDRTNVVAAIKSCDGYLVKPIDKARLIACLKGLGIEPA